MLLQVGLLSLELRNRILHLNVLLLLSLKRLFQVSLSTGHAQNPRVNKHVLANQGLLLVDFVSQGVPDVGSPAGKGLLEFVLLLAKSLDFVVVEVNLLCEGLDSFLKTVDLSLEGGVVHAHLASSTKLGLMHLSGHTTRVLRSAGDRRSVCKCVNKESVRA